MGREERQHRSHEWMYSRDRKSETFSRCAGAIPVANNSHSQYCCSSDWGAVPPPPRKATPNVPDTPLQVTSDGEGVTIPFDAVAAYHGHAALAMLALTFQGLRGALALLSPDRPAPRSDLSVLCGHPGPGVRDAIEFVTRAVTRGAYQVDLTLPEARLNPYLDISYSFRVTLGERMVCAALRPGVLPPRFFELVGTPPDRRGPGFAAEFAALKRSIAVDALREAPDALYDLR